MRGGPYAYLMPPLPEPALDPARTALVVIDMQYFDAHPDHGFGKKLAEQGVGHLAAEFFQRVERVCVPSIRELLRVARASSMDVVFVKIEMQKRDLRDAGRAYRLNNFASPRGSKEAEILVEIAPREEEIVLSKTSSSAFNSTNIDQVLRNLGAENLIVCGVNTNACVELTSRDAADRGYYVVLAEDGCAAIAGNEAHQDALRRMDGGITFVKRTAEIVSQLEAFAAQSAGAR
ncbi:MAG: cysteine hydrolase [Chloroflexi bacterium]|nr:cysteine hydrolase [Chloroflexota bacterium]